MGRKRTEIIIETERILLISRRSESYALWCERCGKSLPMLTVEEAAAVLRVQVDEIFRRIEDEQLHSVQLTGRRMRICPNSLLK
jgi:excisionase family DNA binding protein